MVADTGDAGAFASAIDHDWASGKEIAATEATSIIDGNFTVNGSYGRSLYRDVNWYGLESEYAATGMLTFFYRFYY